MEALLGEALCDAYKSLQPYAGGLHFTMAKKAQLSGS